MRELSPVVSNWRSELSLDEYLRRHGIPGISEIDTRALTKKLRVEGAMKCCLSTLPLEPAEAVRRARAWRDMAGSDYVQGRHLPRSPICGAPTDPANHNEAYVPVGTTFGASAAPTPRFSVAAFDYGAKSSIFRKLVRHGFDVLVLPGRRPARRRSREHRPDAVFLSNGPGDPAALPDIHRTVTELLPDFPIFGICLGHQMITHALGGVDLQAQVRAPRRQPAGEEPRDRQGLHHGAKPRLCHRPEELESRGAQVTEINLNDNTVEGLRHTTLPVFCVQYHPEAAPGPNDADPLFLDFYRLIERRRGREDLNLARRRAGGRISRRPPACPPRLWAPR